MNLEKHLNVKYVHESEKLKPSNLVKNCTELEGEFGTPYLEVVSNKRSVTDSIPSKFFYVITETFHNLLNILVVYNFFILSNSKLHLLKGIDMMIRHLDTSALRLNYLDTGKSLIL